MLNTLIKQVPVVGQAYGFTKTAMKIYNSTSPVEAVKVAAVSILSILQVVKIRDELQIICLIHLVLTQL